MTREVHPGHDGRLYQILQFEDGSELSEWQKTFPRGLTPGASARVVWIGENRLAMGVFPDDPSRVPAAPPTSKPAPSGPAGGAAGAGGEAAEELDSKTVAELRTLCGMRGLAHDSRATKADLLALLRAAAG